MVKGRKRETRIKQKGKGDASSLLLGLVGPEQLVRVRRLISKGKK